jgi:hypothetical protein
MPLWQNRPLVAGGGEEAIDKEHHPNDLRKMKVYNWIREHITMRLPIRVQYYLYLSMMPAFLVKQWLEIALGRKKDRSTWREKMQALFDFFSPIYQNRHTGPEVLGWFKDHGFTHATVCYTGEYGFGARGDLPARPQAACPEPVSASAPVEIAHAAIKR